MGELDHVPGARVEYGGGKQCLVILNAQVRQKTPACTEEKETSGQRKGAAFQSVERRIHVAMKATEKVMVAPWDGATGWTGNACFYPQFCFGM